MQAMYHESEKGNDKICMGEFGEEESKQVS